MKILHRAKEIKTNQWVYGLFTGTNEFIVIGGTPRLATVDTNTICVFIGKYCIESKQPIFTKDIVKDYKGDLSHIEFDDFDCSFKMKSSMVYSGSRSVSGNLTIIGNIIDDKFEEPESKKEATSRTPTSESLHRRSTKESLRGMGLI